MPLNLAFSLCVQTILLHSQIVLFCGLGIRTGVFFFIHEDLFGYNFLVLVAFRFP